MASRASILTLALLLSACTGVRSVQLHPPVAAPAGMVWGYGVEKLKGKNAENGRQAAYLKAIDDLLTRGPILVFKTVQDRTTVLDVRPASRTMESTFRLRASRMLQPSFMESGIEDGFVWVLLGTTESDIERGWQQFIEWRAQRITQAGKLFADARGPEKLSRLRASFTLLEEAGAEDDPGLLYYEVKAALDAEVSRIANLDRFRKDFRKLTDNGQLLAAESTLEQALQSGLDQPAYHQGRTEIHERRHQALQLIFAGDDLLQDKEYRQALTRYQQAEKLDRDNPQLPSKLALAEQYDRETRSQNTRVAVGTIVPAATRAVGEYFAYKREQERRKREEAEKQEAEDRRREQEANANRSRRPQSVQRPPVVRPATTPGVPPPAPPPPSPPPAETPAPAPPPVPAETMPSPPKPQEESKPEEREERQERQERRQSQRPQRRAEP